MNRAADQHLARYRPVEQINAGMGVVRCREDRPLGRSVRVSEGEGPRLSQT